MAGSIRACRWGSPAIDDELIVVRRLRQTVSPEGDLSEEVDEVALARSRLRMLEGEAERPACAPSGASEIAATDDHVGSTVVMLEEES